MKERKKALLVATVQSHIAQFHKPLMRLLKEHGWEIHVAARNNLDEKDGLQLEYPDRVYDIPFQRSPLDRRNLKAYRQLKQLLASTRYDVIHCNTPVGGVLTRFAARQYRKNGTQVYYTAHGFHFYRGASAANWLLYYPVEKWLARFTDKLITINEEDYQLAKRKFSCPVFRIHGVGANSDAFRLVGADEQQRIKAELGLHGHILITVGELLPNKNQKTAILALQKVLETYPETCLLIAGNGPEKESLTETARALGLQDNVRFLGYTTQLQRYLEAADVAIACSYREGLPLNILEAMLCGKPVVASDNRGHRELVHDGINGYLVEADDIGAYVQYICQILEEGKDYSEQTVRSAQMYTDVHVMKELAAIYFEGQQA